MEFKLLGETFEGPGQIRCPSLTNQQCLTVGAGDEVRLEGRVGHEPAAPIIKCDCAVGEAATVSKDQET